VLSDQDVRAAAEAERTRFHQSGYRCLGCSAQCGRCARTIRRIIDEVLGSALRGMLQRLRPVLASLTRSPPAGLLGVLTAFFWLEPN
jgi:bacterioferritin-associated ferredoxin